MFYLTIKIIYLFLNEQKLLSFRKFIVKLYSLYFKIDKRKFLFSGKTINCLVIGSEFSDDATETINIWEEN